jgi:tubulin polyglutamylase TTLL6/13
MPSEVTDFKN